MKTKNNKNKNTKSKVAVKPKATKVTKVTKKVTKRVAKIASPSVGRPALVIKYPRKKVFTLMDLQKLNDVSTLTLRNRLAQVASVSGHLPREGRGHPVYTYSLN